MDLKLRRTDNSKSALLSYKVKNSKELQLEFLEDGILYPTETDVINLKPIYNISLTIINHYLSDFLIRGLNKKQREVAFKKYILFLGTFVPKIKFTEEYYLFSKDNIVIDSEITHVKRYILTRKFLLSNGAFFRRSIKNIYGKDIRLHTYHTCLVGVTSPNISLNDFLVSHKNIRSSSRVCFQNDKIPLITLPSRINNQISFHNY